MNQKPKGLLFKNEMIMALLNTQVDVWPAKPVDESMPWKWQNGMASPTPGLLTQILQPAGYITTT